MSDVPAFEGALWREFLSRHLLSESEQEAFLDYVTRPGVQEIPDLDALETAYLEFLRTGSPPPDLV